MNNIDNETRILRVQMRNFIIDAIQSLKNFVKIESLPTIKNYRIEENGDRIKYLPYKRPNWYQLQGLHRLSNLKSFCEVYFALQKHKQAAAIDGKIFYVAHVGTPFDIIKVPFEFLLQFLDRTNELKFNQKTFDTLFNDFLLFIKLNNTLTTHIIVPLDNMLIAPRVFNLDSGFRIRYLRPYDLIDVINNNPILGSFYGTSLSLWFSCVLEFDMSFSCSWENRDSEPYDHFMRIGNELQYKTTRINQEIVMLRAILKQPISSPIYVIDYRGWNSDLLTHGPITRLPWTRHQLGIPDRLDLKQLNKYKKFRLKFIEMENKKAQQQIFVAMRKLASSFDRAYGGDEIMELVSGLEGLLVNEKIELKHRFAERVALLLKDNPQDRKNLFEDMKLAYDLRSDVAHGLVITDELDSIVLNNLDISSKKIKKFNKLQNLRPKTRDLLHEAILTCIDKQTTKFDWDSALMRTSKKPQPM